MPTLPIAKVRLAAVNSTICVWPCGAQCGVSPVRHWSCQPAGHFPPYRRRLPLAFKSLRDGGRADVSKRPLTAGRCQIRRLSINLPGSCRPRHTPKVAVDRIPSVSIGRARKTWGKRRWRNPALGLKKSAGEARQELRELDHLVDHHRVWSSRSLAKISGSGVALGSVRHCLETWG